MGIPVLDGVASFSAPYDVILCDLWGVVHNGVHAHTDALQVLRHWRDDGKRVILLSNAPRPYQWSIKRMEPMGVTPDHYDDVVTAGDLARNLISSGSFQQETGKKLYHLGPALNSPTFDGTGVSEVADVAEADFVICTAFHNEATETAEDYRDELAGFLKLNLPLVCANPDLEVGQGDVVRPCAGAIAALYEGMGGVVHWCGKPDARSYEMCLGRAGDVATEKVLAIGDGLRTDIRGANLYGIDSLFISTGIHGPELAVSGRQEAVFDDYGAHPTAIMSTLKL